MAVTTRMVVGLGAVLTLALVVACATANEQARACMTGDQLKFLEGPVSGVKKDMSEREVTQLLGPPTRGEGTPRICYAGPEVGVHSEVCVEFIRFKARRVQWLQGGESEFSYEIELE